MAGKFLSPGAIANTIKSRERMDAKQKRAGEVRYHVDAVPCGCSDETCGAFHVARTDRPLPNPTEADATLAAHQRARKERERRAKPR